MAGLEKVEHYIKGKEWERDDLLKLVGEVADLGENQESKENEGFKFSDWLKNDKNLLEYAKLYNKPEKLSAWESIKFKLLEVKLSITCPYFADFKDFLEELKRWPDTSKVDVATTPAQGKTSGESVSEADELSRHKFCGMSIDNIKSEPFQRNSLTWVTWCSKTARFNWYNFGINLPSWNAYEAGKNPWKDSIQTIPENKVNKKPKKWWKWIEPSAFKSLTKWNYADIYVESKSNYGHRAAAFKDDSWQWYVLDPYIRVNWKLDDTPKRLEDYSNARNIVKAHIYESKWYEKKSDHEDIWSWYEWKNH